MDGAGVTEQRLLHWAPNDLQLLAGWRRKHPSIGHRFRQLRVACTSRAPLLYVPPCWRLYS